MTSRASSCRESPYGPASTNDSARSQPKSSSPAASPKAPRRSPAVVKRAWAAISTAARCCAPGVPDRKVATSRPTTSGTAPSSTDGPGRPPGGGRRPPVPAVREHLEQQRERERMAVRELEELRDALLGQAGAA